MSDNTQPDPLATYRVETRLTEAGQAHMSGDLARAAALYGEVIDFDAENAAALHALGVIRLQEGKPGEGLDWLKRALRADGGKAVIWNDLGEAYRVTSEFALAREAYEKALSIQPAMPEAANNYGVLLCQMQEPGKAESRFREAIALNPDYAEAYNNLGVLLADQRRWNEAVVCFENAVKIKPDYVDALENYMALLKQGEDMIRHVERLLAEARAQVAGDDPTTH